ncbi:RsmB/NOP family class I SAM-dependent RNA methyltransferase [Rubinisphaera brasiliensis]|uniref:Fmu (Sun) domain protein n=1 Tax=Rubinisphaera brasiliensis (strain ATCC 49424 / DSM 5305 / JCM 21570 / IAM 15109 / NBRC 103401 / IFAM 1448) TaxID=756272 RepID=F0SFH7_RUBBR|nr:transcription antitermination factor NusB [Rubinisphaera brasiliensis]ADY59384.1 Fmu (Sun) domain protein [Rubinisphaera brasiliensis DSM 5305]
MSPARRPSRRPSRPAPKPADPQTSRQWTYRLLEGWRTEQQLIRDQLQLFRQDQITSDTHQGAGWAERAIIRQRTIDRVLREAVSRARENVQNELWTLLRMGAAELLFGPRDAQYAAISETVELARWVGHSEWTGFLNGVLRGVQRMLSEEESDTVGKDCFPVADNIYRKLNKPIFPDPETQTVDYIGLAFSLPGTLAKAWASRYSHDELWPVVWSTLSPPPLGLRINRVATDPQEWLARCEAAGVEIGTTEFPEAFQLLSKTRLHDIPGFTEGEVVVQDLTAMHAVRLLNPYPKDDVLDLCAGPGTKTTQMAELMLDQGSITATDVTQARLDQISENAERLSFSCIHPMWIERTKPEIDNGPFDAVLADVPCSNTGVLGKRPEARWRYSPEDIVELNKLQRRLLDVAASQVEEDGRIVYSTCSIEPAENEQFIVEWLRAHPEFECVEMKTVLPSPEHDGGFCARLEYRETDEADGENAEADETAGDGNATDEPTP